MRIEQIINGVIDREKGYVNNPNDRGGATNWGITEAVARAEGYHGNMAQLPRETAARIYRKRYISEPGFHRVLTISAVVGEEMVDTGVNMGVSVPAPWLQRVLNALNRQGRDFPDLAVDGDIGPATLAALRSVLDRRGRAGELVVFRWLNCMQGARYLALVEGREANEEFAYGWMLNRVNLGVNS